MRLEEQIRRYAEAVDSMAPIAEDLMPPGMSDNLEAGVQPVVEVTIPSVTPKRRRRVPGWVIGVAAAAVAILLVVPVWLWLTSVEQDVVDTPPTLETPVDSTAYPLLFDLDQSILTGSGWTPNTELTITLTSSDRDVVTTAMTDESGSFAASDIGGCCIDATLTVTDGERSESADIDGSVEMYRVDPANDIIAGGTSFDQPVVVRISGGGEPYEVLVQATNGVWSVDLSGEFDILPGMTVQAIIERPGIALAHTSGMKIDLGFGIRPTRNVVEGQGWAPNTPVTVTINGQELPDRVLTDSGGFFIVDVSLFGLSLEAGDDVLASDGIETLRAIIPALTFDVLDHTNGVASGTVSSVGVSSVDVTIETGPIGSGQEDRQQSIEAIVVGQTWRVEFNPPGPGDEVVGAWVVAHVRNAWVQVDADIGGDVNSGSVP